MCDKREIKKEVLHHVSKSPCLSSDRPCRDVSAQQFPVPTKRQQAPHPGPAVIQDIYLYKHRNLEFYNPFVMQKYSGQGE